MALGQVDVHMQKNEVDPISQLWLPGQNTKTGWLDVFSVLEAESPSILWGAIKVTW